MSATKKFPTRTMELLREEIEIKGFEADAYLREAAKLPESQQSHLLETIDQIQTDQEVLVATLKKLLAKEIAENEKAAETYAHRPVRLVPDRPRMLW